MQASPNKYSGRCSDYSHSKHVTLRIHLTLNVSVFDTLFPLLLHMYPLPRALLERYCIILVL